MITIIGAGLSGLLTAYRLHQANIPYRVLEARDRIGGRIHTVISKNGTPVEMGATWFQSVHVSLISLLNELGISHYEQFMKGIAFYQADLANPARPVQLPEQQPSYRIAGGTSALIHKLYSKLNKDWIFLNQPVSKVSFQKDAVEIEAKDRFQSEKVILCLPPKLLAEKIRFEPNLPKDLLSVSNQTHTWMEDSVKVALVYNDPFWREKQFSGAIFSSYGPMTELYDHNNFDGSRFALCGFLHPNYIKIPEKERKSYVLEQISKSFGSKAQEFESYHESVWKQETFTANPTGNPLYAHQNNGNPIFGESFFGQRLFISNSETAQRFGGYMEGAVNSAEQIANQVLRQLNV